MTPENLDLIAGWVALGLTLMVFSYLLGDNFLYRIAIHVLVGVAAGYTVIVLTESVMIPWLNETLLAETEGRSGAMMTALRVVGTVPFLGGALLLFKASPRLALIGDWGLAPIIGVGVAVALVGAIAGTIVPLAQEAGEAVGDDTEDGLVILVGVISTLIYFQYWAVERHGELQRPRLLRGLSAIGHLFVMVTLGALYAGAILTSVAIFSDVIRQHLEFVLDKIGG
ncbi:MAG: hypothetical protein HY866_02110 [Chloroflexi bacterium]|nr:hypothetical protein [Chloroflexota bacterium]